MSHQPHRLRFAVACLFAAQSLWVTAGCRDDFVPPGADEEGETGETSGDGDGDGDTVGTEDAYYDDYCLLDADCGPTNHCELGVCASGCNVVGVECDDGLTCSPRGRCVIDVNLPETLPLPAGEGMDLAALRTPTEDDGTAQNVLTNTSDRPQRWRVSVETEGVNFEPSIQSLAPGDSAVITIEIDDAVIPFEITAVPVVVHTGEGTLSWVVDLPRDPTGHYTGVLSFQDGAPRAESRLGLNLEFAETGEITGQSFDDETLGWPRDASISGLWDPATREVEIVLYDIIPAEAIGVVDPPANPLDREIGRRVIMRGTVDESFSQISGEFEERLSGLMDTLTIVRGPFNLTLDGRMREASATVTDFEPQGPVYVPTWEFPPDLDNDECTDLGVTDRYGTDTTIVGGDASECTACVGLGATCTVAAAQACADLLLASGSNLPTESASGSMLQPPASTAWATCVNPDDPTYAADGTTCLDREAVRCAGALYRHALALDGGSNESLLEGYLEQVRHESEMGAAVGTEMLIQAMFAYQDVTGAAVWLTERDRLVESQALLARPLEAMFAPGFHHVLQGLGKEKIRDERFGADLQRMLDIGSRSVETTVSQLRLQQRTEAGDPAQIRKRLSYANAWGHLQGVLMQQLVDRFEVPPTYAQLALVSESNNLMASMVSELGNDKNPFGFSPSYVPLKLATTGTGGALTSNYEVIRSDADLQVDFYKSKLSEAETALQVFAQNEYNIVNQTNQVVSNYNEQLIRLCGQTTTGGPNTAACGMETGEVRELLIAIEIAKARIEQAETELANNQQAVLNEADRVRELIANAQDLEMSVGMLNEDIFKIEDDLQNDISVVEAQALEAECAHGYKTAAIETAVIVAETAAEVADAAGEVPPNVSGAVAAGVVGAVSIGAEFGKAALDCDEAKRQAGFEDEITDLQNAADREIKIINQQVDLAVRASQINEEVINSKYLVKNMLMSSVRLAQEVKEAVLEAQLAAARLQTAITEVTSLLASRDRALSILETDPNNPFTNARFLRTRLELGRHLQRWRDLALRASYRAGRALEYELNRDVTFIETQLYPARGDGEVDGFLFCLDAAFQQYQEDFSDIGSQELVSVVSLRDEVFGFNNTLTDAVTGDPVTPAEQFRALVVHPDNINRSGSLELTFALPVAGSTIFAQTQCDDRIEAIEIRLVGENLGDDEFGALVYRTGTSTLKRCDSANLSIVQSLVDYQLDPEVVGIQGVTSEWAEDDSGKSFGYAGWPFSGDQWTLEVPNGNVDPRNADFDFRDIADIELRVTHRAGTVSNNGDGFVPICG